MNLLRGLRTMLMSPRARHGYGLEQVLLGVTAQEPPVHQIRLTEWRTEPRPGLYARQLSGSSVITVSGLDLHSSPGGLRLLLDLPRAEAVQRLGGPGTRLGWSRSRQGLLPGTPELLLDWAASQVHDEVLLLDWAPDHLDAAIGLTTRGEVALEVQADQPTDPAQVTQLMLDLRDLAHRRYTS